MVRKVFLTVLLLTFATVVRAGIIYNNISSATAGSDGFSTVGPPLFDSFSTGASGFTLA